MIKIKPDTIISDCNYTFSEAVKGSKAPEYIINQLELIEVHYYALDGKLHKGQLLTNKLIAKDLIEIFQYIKNEKFPIAQVVPIVRYNWNDNESMVANNTYSFCFRNVSFSKHARGLAIDINPFFNPVRWKEGYTYRKDKPEGAVFNPQQPGTFITTSKIVEKFKSKKFFWGHNFRQKCDDHHFEK